MIVCPPHLKSHVTFKLAITVTENKVKWESGRLRNHWRIQAWVGESHCNKTKQNIFFCFNFRKLFSQIIHLSSFSALVDSPSAPVYSNAIEKCPKLGVKENFNIPFMGLMSKWNNMEIIYHDIIGKVLQEMSWAQKPSSRHSRMWSGHSEDAPLPPPAAFLMPLSTDQHSATLAGPHKHEAVEIPAS